MSKSNLLLMVNGADNNTAYAISTEYGITYVDEIRIGKDGVPTRHIFCDGELEGVDVALKRVMEDRNSVEDPQALVIKSFKRFGDNHIDIGRAWVITEDEGNYNFTTEIDGVVNKVRVMDGTNDILSLQNLDTAVEFVGFLEHVYSEHNSRVGERTVSFGALYNKAIDILTKPFDVEALKLLRRQKESIER